MVRAGDKTLFYEVLLFLSYLAKRGNQYNPVKDVPYQGDPGYPREP